MTTRIPDILETDVLVIGAGMAGVCAAIQAARHGCSVILLEKERVLGGNSNPNCGVHVSGAHRYHPYAVETGIINEIFEKAAWYHTKTWTEMHEYNMSQQWDTVLAGILKEAGVLVLRCHYARAPIKEGDSITAVLAEDTAACHTRRIHVNICVIESSGDGNVACEAGAEFMTGSEARDDYNERKAPAVANKITLGSSVVALVRRTPSPIKFVPPPDTPEFYPGYGGYIDRWKDSETDTLRFFKPTETGGDLDTIEDDHAIYERAVRHLYSAWNYVKNIRYKEEAKNWDLLWIGTRLARRESRRFKGDYVLTQQDVEEGVIFADAVAYGGFSIDIHDPKPEKPEYISIRSYSIPPIYTIPYRCLYSKNISNLFLASRLFSVTHIAHGSTRVQRTLSAIGQAVGAAAALCKKYGCTPRDIYGEHMQELQQTLLREDASIPGLRNLDPTDLVPKANITASSEVKFAVDSLSGWLPLDRTRGIMLWDWNKRLDTLSFYIRNESGGSISLRACLKLRQAHRKRREDIITQEDEREKTKGFSYWQHKNSVEWGDNNSVAVFNPVAQACCEVEADYEGWVTFKFATDMIEKDPACDEDRYVIEVEKCEKVRIGINNEYRDFVRRIALEEDSDIYDTFPDSHMFAICPQPAYGEAVNVVNGINRRYCTNPVNMWIAQKSGPKPHYIQLEWEKVINFDAIQLTFDTITRTVGEMPYECAQRVSGRCIRDYRMEVWYDGSWQTLCEIRDNYNRFRRHSFESVAARKLRIVVEAVWDSAFTPRIYEIRVYNQSGIG